MITVDVWERFSGDLQQFIYRRVTNRQDAEDLLQDIFLKIHTRIDTLREEERLAAWVYQIARNTITDYYRRNDTLVELPDSLPELKEEGEENAIALLAVGLNDMIATLPDIYRQPLILSEIKGEKQAVVAQQLGLSLSGAKSRVQRGRNLLKQSLLDCCHFEYDRRGGVIDYYPKQACCAQCNC